MARVTSRELHCDVTKTLFLDVIASFSRTIFKCQDGFSRLNVFVVKFLLNTEFKPFFGVIFLMVQILFKFDKK